MTGLPQRARVVVVGGGVVGCSVAYHLTRLGWTDVLLLEQGRLSSGTTWHAAGLVGPLRASESGTRLVQYSAELYTALEEETGLATGYRNVGGVIVARTEDRMVQLRRTAANAAAYDMDCELIGPERARELWPPMQVDDVLGAIWLPGDGKVNPTDVTQSLAKGARQRGARIVEKVQVTAFDVTETAAGRRVTGVRTDRGDVEAEVVVNCAGQWAKALGDLVGVPVPLHSAEHFYVVTEEVEGTHPDLPIMRDPDGWTYFKEEVGGLVVGGFEPEAKPWRSPDDLPHPFEFQLLEEDWEHFSVLMDEALVRVPALEHTGIRKFYNGPESFTPDNQFLLGEAPGLAGFFVGAGFNSVGIASAGGAGRALAEWIVAGEPQDDLVGVDLRRFASFHADNAWLRSRVSEVLGLHYAVPWPNRELESGRPQRTSPVHDRLAARGAVFGTRMGWERPNVFAPTPAEARLDYAWGRPSWLPWSVREQEACRGDVAVFDQTSFSKYVVAGADALAGLQRVCAADVDVPVDHCVYTPFLNSRGTYEADLTVTRTGTDSFLLVSSSATTVRDLDWLTRHGVAASDVTDEHAVLGVMGPRSRALLSGLSDDDWGEEEFPFATSREVAVAGVRLRATRMTYVGELGWELMVPVAGAGEVLDALSAGGAADAGYYTIDSLRLEKGYRAFGRELTPDVTPVEAGLVFATALKGDKDFLGRAALEARRTELAAGGPRRRLVSWVASDPEVMLWGGELLLRDGDPAGQVTSAAWGAAVGASVGLAWYRAPGPVTAADLARGGFQVDVAGALVDVRVTLKAPLV
ncbi:FAD-dependent oxidoreductase [Nocardioides sp. SYSU D00038]|uniref:GcvT family protein n=1 Tax=Nocardioides sp. SYSU D00038 TaxID=2812554 RepID=UPI001966F1B6|nr:FAD-dependent oxidoreductase [Nocardioides sp. SYSU D00038]